MKLGILGGGQLGRMLAMSGLPLGVDSVCLDPAADAPAAAVAEHVLADYDDPSALAALARCEVVTYEFESVPEGSAAILSQSVPVYPPAGALRVAQDRLLEKTCFRDLGIATPEFAAVSTEAELARAIERLGLPAVLKTRRLGYDGKGQRVLRGLEDVAPAWNELGSVPLLLERFVPFDREASIIAVRDRNGSIAYYPLVENRHEAGILRVSLAPSPSTSAAHESAARWYVQRLLEHLEYVGVLALELFVVGDELYANEMAPRVHNSGHFSIEGAETSQFENHVRAVCGLPLGSTELVGCSAMLNLIGTVPNTADILAIPGAHLHLYGKQPRPGRKLGHITLRARDANTLQAHLAAAENVLRSSRS